MNQVHPAVELGGRARSEVLFAILLALFLGALDQTIVGTALPTIVRDLQGSTSLYTWAVTAYLLTSTIVIPIYGKLSDLYGRKPMLLIGVTLFLLGSALSGLSQDMTQLIVFRGIQGLGAGSLFPIALAVIGDLFTPAERGKYQGLFGAVFGVAAIIGPWLGGFLTEHVSWHWIFYINLPIGLLSMVVIWRVLPTVRREGASRSFDYRGVGVFAAAVALLLVGLTNAQSTRDFAAWVSPEVGGLIALSAALAGLFLWIEVRTAEPIVPLGLFRNRTYAFAVATNFLASFGFFGTIIFLPLWLQAVQGFSPTDSGWALLPMLAGLIFASIASGQLVSRSGRYKLLTSGALAWTALGVFLMTGLHGDTAYAPTLVFWMVVVGLGVGPTMPIFTLIVQNAVPFEKLGVATSNITFLRQIGGTVGLALAGTVFGSSLTTELPRQLVSRGVPQEMVERFAAQASDFGSTGGNLADTLAKFLPPEQVAAIVGGFNEALSLAIANAFWVALVAVIVAFGTSLLIPELPLRRTTRAHELARTRAAALEAPARSE